uniref:Uncharacterized protein n=1 Tax=Solanum lycopersicum TaxID=4081 RepID=A0A3Q7HM01_SOLLC
MSFQFLTFVGINFLATYRSLFLICYKSALELCPLYVSCAQSRIQASCFSGSNTYSFRIVCYFQNDKFDNLSLKRLPWQSVTFSYLHYSAVLEFFSGYPC